MPRSKRILFPVDLSPQCAAVAPFVRTMAKTFHADVVVANVLEALSGYYKDWNAYLTLVNWEGIKEDRERRLTAFVRKAFPKLPVETVMLEGEAARTIVTYAAKHKIDLIMMPTHGYGPFRDLLIGSVTAKVLHDSKVPVWTSVHASDFAPPKSRNKRILCAIDYTQKDMAALKWAAGFAAASKAKLILTHAVPGKGEVDPSLQSFLLSAAEEKMNKLQQTAGVRYQTIIDIGEISDVVSRAAARSSAEAVIIGRGHLTTTFGRLRTNTYDVIRRSPCPVISI